MIGATAASAQSPRASTRALAFDAYTRCFYNSNNGPAFFKDTANSGRNSNFWQNAEMIEMAEDAYDRSPDSSRKQMVEALCKGFQSRWGTDWSSNSYNDDIMWASIAFIRAKAITGQKSYGQAAASNFDAVWKRAWDTTLGGGLWWSTAKKGKNACVNGPGAIAAMLLNQAHYGSDYRNKAKQIYSWERSHLVNTSTGQVADHMNADGAVSEWAFTYNQGTFAGAAALLYQSVGGGTYAQDGKLAIQWCRDHLTDPQSAGILKDESNKSGVDGDGMGFKGIFVRWACRWIKATGDKEFNAWLQQNANTVWQNRNSSGVTWTQWRHKSPDTAVTSWECSSALALLQDCP